MCGILLWCATLCNCCCGLFRSDHQLDACCLCIPLRTGAVLFALFYALTDVAIVTLFATRYYNDPFSDNNTKVEARSSDDLVDLRYLLEEIKRSVHPAVQYEVVIVLALLCFFALWECLDLAVLVGIVLRWLPMLKAWLLLSMFRPLHLFFDIALIGLTILYIDNGINHLYPNFVSLLSLVPLSYAKSVFKSYAKDTKHRREREEIERRVNGMMSTPGPRGWPPDPTAGSSTPRQAQGKRDQQHVTSSQNNQQGMARSHVDQKPRERESLDKVEQKLSKSMHGKRPESERNDLPQNTAFSQTVTLYNEREIVNNPLAINIDRIQDSKNNQNYALVHGSSVSQKHENQINALVHGSSVSQKQENQNNAHVHRISVSQKQEKQINSLIHRISASQRQENQNKALVHGSSVSQKQENQINALVHGSSASQKQENQSNALVHRNSVSQKQENPVPRVPVTPKQQQQEQRKPAVGRKKRKSMQPQRGTVSTRRTTPPVKRISAN